MMGKKTLKEVRAEVGALLGALPGASPKAWIKKEISRANRDPNGDAETLEMLCEALKNGTTKKRTPKAKRIKSRS